MMEQRIAILEQEMAKLKKALMVVSIVAFSCAVALGLEL